MTDFQIKQTKVSGSSAGETANVQKGVMPGSANVHKSMRFAKQGKTNRASYSGPNVAQASR